MVTRYPGTTIEVVNLRQGSSRSLFDGIFATGGITLSQVSNMTGLEPYLIQNWVKRKFVSSPTKKMYSKEQFARIIIINMLRESLQIESICNLIKIIGGDVDDQFDDLIKDDELYHRYVDMLCDGDIDDLNEINVRKIAENAVHGFGEMSNSTTNKLVRILEIMFYAHKASQLRDSAKELLSTLQ
jgi:DNA-binding transcriptional MerR regulator